MPEQWSGCMCTAVLTSVTAPCLLVHCIKLLISLLVSHTHLGNTDGDIGATSGQH